MTGNKSKITPEVHVTCHLYPVTIFMPELPEVETVVNELNKKLKNRIIKSVSVTRQK